MKLLDTTYKIFSQEIAAMIAADLTAGEEDGWSYVVINNPDPEGPRNAFIEIYDEDGLFVARV